MENKYIFKGGGGGSDVEGKFFVEEDLLQRIINFTKGFDDIIEIYEKEDGQNSEKMGQSYENLCAKMDFNKMYSDFIDNYGDPLGYYCPCFPKYFQPKTLEVNFQIFSKMKIKMHEAFLFFNASNHRIQAITGKQEFPEEMRKKIMTDEPKKHIENVLKRIHAKLG